MNSKFMLLFLIIFLCIPLLVLRNKTAIAGWECQHPGQTLGGVIWDAWGNSATDFFVVGDGVHYFDGNSWSEMVSSSYFNLYGVWGSSNSNVFVVGSFGTILHYDGINWTEIEYGGEFGPFYNDVWGSSENDVFIVGEMGVIRHYDGSNWSYMDTGTNKHLNSIWGSSGSDIYATGGNPDGPILLHYDGISWSEKDIGITVKNLGSIWGSSDSDIFIDAHTEEGPVILHYDGTTWSEMDIGNNISYLTDLCGRPCSNGPGHFNCIVKFCGWSNWTFKWYYAIDE